MCISIYRGTIALVSRAVAYRADDVFIVIDGAVEVVPSQNRPSSHSEDDLEPNICVSIGKIKSM